MAYSLLAGMPPIYGLYASLIPIVVYSIFASSTKLSIGPVAVSALLVLAGVSQIAEPGTPTYISYVITLGLLIGVFQILLGLLKMGFLVNFLSHPVIAGFTSAAAIIIVISQLKDILGIDMVNSHDSFTTLRQVISNVGSLNVLSALLSVTALGLILFLRKINRNIPSALIAVILGIIVGYIFKLDEHGVKLVGEIPAGLPEFQLPVFNKEIILRLLPTMLTVALIGIVESIGIAKALESKHKDHTVIADQELVALGLAKVAGSFFQAIPTSGSFSRSAINSSSGAKTVMSGMITVVIIVVALLFMTTCFYYLPKGILAAIILLAVISLFDLKEAKYLWKSNRLDFWMMMATFLFTLALGIETGVLSGVLLSILVVLYNTSMPTMTELGSIEGTEYYRSIFRFDQAVHVKNVLIVRFENEIFFGNSGLFKEKLNNMLAKHEDEVKFIVLDGSLISNIDSTGAHMLTDLVDDLAKSNIEFHLCGAVGTLRDKLYKAGLLSETDKHHLSVHAAISYIQCNIDKELIRRPINPLQTNES